MHVLVCEERKFKFVNREESIDKHIKTLVRYTFCNSNLLRNLSLQFITNIQFEIFANKGQNSKFPNHKSQVIHNKIPKFPNAKLFSFAATSKNFS